MTKQLTIAFFLGLSAAVLPVYSAASDTPDARTVISDAEGADNGVNNGMTGGDNGPQQESQQLSERLKIIQTLSGSFTQRQYDEEGQLLGNQQGHFSIAVPGKVRWETFEPFPQLLVSDGRQFWLYDPDLEQVTVSGVGTKLQTTPAVLFSGDADALHRHYAVKQSSDHSYTLVPRETDSLFSYISIQFEGDTLSAITMADSLGQKTHFELKNTRKNVELAQEQFEFEIPQGVDVIQQ